MQTKPTVLFLLICFELLLVVNASAQNIRNDTILVSKNALVELRFPEKKSAGKVPGANGAYELGGTKRSLTVRAVRDDVPPQQLVITDGPRTHKFVLVYAEIVPQSQLVVDWSNLKKLKEYVRTKEENANRVLNDANELYKQGALLEALSKYNWLKEEIDESKDLQKAEFIKTRLAEIARQTHELSTSAMTRGDQLAKEKKYKEAWDAYKEAMQYDLSDAAAKKLKEVTGSAFRECIIKAQKAEDSRNYMASKMSYEEARMIDPEAFEKSYQQKFDSVVKQANDQLLEQIIEAGDDAAEIRNWPGAKALYDSASKLKPNEPAVTQKIKKAEEEIKSGLDYRKKEAEYYGILSRAKLLASRAFSEADFAAALDEYTRAGKLFPDRKFPKDRIAELKKKQKNASAKK